MILKDDAALTRTKDRALKLLGMRAFGERELYERLLQKGETEQNAATTIAWLLELRLLDDGEYAAMLVRHYAAKGFGPRRIRDELYRRKIPRELWDEALSEIPEQDDTIDKLLRARLRSDEPDRAELKRATDALLRRGFGWDEIKEAVERLQLE